MNLLERLQNNKGTISSALGKELGAEIASGNHELLREAVTLTVYDAENPRGKNVRAGAEKAFDAAAAAIREQNGVCLSGSAELYLGDLGAASPQATPRALALLIEAFRNAIPAEIDWILEAFMAMSGNLSAEERTAVLESIGEPAADAKKSTVKRYAKLKKKIQDG